MEILKELLECTICLEFAISPIHNCSNGHIVCAICIKKVTKCGMCQDELVPCGFAERLVRRDDFRLPCTNADFGCQNMMEPTKMNTHLKDCQYMIYKPFKCIFFRHNKDNVCGSQNYNLNDYEEYDQHLRQVHKVRDLEEWKRDDDDKEGSFCLFLMYLGELDPLSHKSFLSWPNLEVVPEGTKKFDGHTFLVITEKLKKTLTWKVAIVGGENEAKNYQYCVKLKSESEPYCEFTWKGPVFAFLKCQRESKKDDLETVAASIHCPAGILPFCNIDEDSEEEWGVKHYFLETEIEISKVK